jgi:hypothetical protein
MRPLVWFVFAESVVIAALIAVLLSGSAPAGASHTPMAMTASPADAASLAKAPKAAPAGENAERHPAAPLEPEVLAADPVGIVVAGTVHSSSGAPVADATISFRRDHEYRGASSQQNGLYAAAGLWPAEWRVRCESDGYAPRDLTVTLDQRSFQRLDLELQPAWMVLVKIQNAAGEHLPDLLGKHTWSMELCVVATAAPLEGDLPLTVPATHQRFCAGEWRTNSGLDGGQQDKKLREQGYAGTLLLDSEPPVFAALVLRHRVLKRQRIEAGQKELVFTLELDEVLQQFGELRLQLVDAASGQPLPRVNVELSIAADRTSSRVSGEDGRVVLHEVAPGLLSLSAWSKDYEYLFRWFRMPPGGRIDLGEVRLSPAMMVTATVVDQAGKPVTDANLQYTSLDDRSFPQPLCEQLSSPVDANGQTKLRLGRHRYVVSAGSRAGSAYALVDASHGEPAPVTLTLGKRTRIAIRTGADPAVGYLVTFLDRSRAPVRVLTFGGQSRPDATSLLPGDYTVEVHDGADRMVHNFPLTVGSEPMTIDLP